MAKTSTERSRELRAKRKAAQRAAPDLTTNYLRRTFFEAAAGRLRELDFYWNSMGVEGPAFDDDRCPRSYDGAVEQIGSDVWEAYSRDSLGRAESIVSLLLDTASELAHAINEYKLDEISARIAEIEKADLSLPEVKARALSDIVTLQAIKERLEGKSFRRSFAEFSVKGNVSN
ncbi:hypothetical protein SAMN02983003_1655 [Devosia enhydra]|uniref:Uncharacterized protein n=1 Tax=Devosia enhydra TaxID=665118 RepID=A0A1K2HWK4_9HYPH|nr:hypothetical protein [Devosia enhydra]SFZ83458.1 hypothetical protein SAMN02983003_1655 [Devosia enhydra]